MLELKYCLVLLVVGSFHRVAAQKLHQPCYLKSGKDATCKQIDECKPVFDDLRLGKMPEIVCGYRGAIPFVCCPTNWSRRIQPAVTATTTTTARPTVRTNPWPDARKARQMCAEYASEVYQMVDTPVLLLSRQKANMSTCAIKSKKLIVGGKKAESGEFPHMAALGYDNYGTVVWGCGGTLISDLYIMTAAHCTSSGVGPVKYVRVGDLKLHSTDDDAEPQDFQVAQIIKHPNYNSKSKFNDIALLRLDRRVKFTKYARPACLSLTADVSIGEKVIATGWGRLDWNDNTRVDNLMKVTLPIVSYEKCEEIYRSKQRTRPIRRSSQLCAGELGKDTCDGDSGGPLVTYHKEEECMYDVIGLTSYGKMCGMIEPGVYTKVYNYLSWIEETVWPN